jgi:hypothetical protein
MISYFFEFRKVENNHTNKIKKFNSEIEKTKSNKLSIDELTKKQTNEHEVKTTLFSILNSFFSVNENDSDNRFLFAKFSKDEKITKDSTNSNAESREKIKIESQNSQ